MDPVALKEKEKYDKLWNSFPDYRQNSAADLLTPVFIDFFKDQMQPGDSVIDFGCGTGRAATPLLKKNLKVSLIDFCENCLDSDIFLLTLDFGHSLRFTQACLWDLPSTLEKAEWMICLDVLEHIPEEKVDRTLMQMASHMKKGGLLSIALFDDHHGKDISETLHVCVKTRQWWQEKVARHFSITKEFFSFEDLVICPKDYLVCAVAPVN